MLISFDDITLSDRLLTKVPDWYLYTLDIETDKGHYQINWESVDKLAFYTTFQIGLGNHGPVSLQNFYNLHNQMRQEEWNRNHSLGTYNDLPRDANILDIGCGVGINSLILHNYLPESKLNLLDKNAGWEEVKDQPRDFLNGYNEEYVFYNDTSLTEEAIRLSNMDSDRFRFMTPDSEWEQYDLIQSTWSYAWHYPLDIYYEKVLQCLKPGGKLLLDIWRVEDAERISKDLNCEPELSDFPIEQMVCGHSKRFLWTRK